MNSAGFLHPALFVGLLLLAGFGFWLKGLEKSIGAIQRDIGRPALKNSRQRVWIPLALLTLGIVALARPYWGKEAIDVVAKGRDVFVMVDISLSMLTQDVAPSRMEFAKRKARDIVTFERSHNAEDRIGIILFAGDAYVYCPPTSDHLVVDEFIQNISPELITSRGSSLIKALETAKKALEDSRGSNPRFIILGDGEDLQTSGEALKKELANLTAPTIFLGIGTPEGMPITLPEGGYLSSHGEIVNSKLQEEQLKEVFSGSSHAYRRATILDSDFSSFLLAQSPSSSSISQDGSSKREITTYGELGPLLFAAALLSVFLLAVAGNLRTTLLAFIAVIAIESTAQAQHNPLNDSLGYEAFQHYQRGEYQEAYELYAGAAEENPDDAKILQGLGSSAFKLGQFDKAEAAFQQFEKSAKTRDQLFDAPYNLGNSLLAGKKYKEAIDAYDRALSVKENEVRALNNKAIAEAYLKQQEEEKKKQDEQKEDKKDPEDKEKEDSKKDNQEEKEKKESQENDNSQDEKKQNEEQKEENKEEEGEEEKKKENEDQKSQEGEQPTPSATATAEGEATPEAAPSATAQSQASPSANEKQGQPLDQTPLTEREAKEWLKALPESPLLMQRLNKNNSPPPGGQLW